MQGRRETPGVRTVATIVGALQGDGLAAQGDFVGTERPGRRVAAVARQLGGRRRLATRFEFAAAREANLSATLW